MNPRLPTVRRALVVVAALAAAASACTDNESSSDSGTIEVTSTDDECRLAVESAESGNLVFEVHNEGSQVTEFYLYSSDGESIVGEVENIGPGITRELVVDASPGEYITACKPGMTGDGIRASFTVTESTD